MKTLIATVLLALFIGNPALAQWEQVADKSVPRTSSGKPELSAPAMCKSAYD